jgi:hypothetical protein
MPHVTLLWMLVGVALLAGVWWFLTRLQGQGASDGTTFTCRVQPLDHTYQPVTAKWSDASFVVGPGWVDLRGRGVQGGRYTVLGESDAAPSGRAMFALELGSDRYVLSVPAGSPAADQLRNGGIARL